MNILNFIEKVSDTTVDTAAPQTRQEALLSMTTLGKKIAMAAVPGALLIFGSSKKAMAASNDAITDVLNFALTLEYLEREYYNMGVASGVIPSADLAVFQQIQQHENAHVPLLASAITSLGGTPVSKPTFDFTARGSFTPFVVYDQFLALSQAFEDTGVRAYKGQAGNLISNNDILTVALQIHSVEARHASEVRRLRAKLGKDTTKSWITGSSRGTMPSATQAVYNGEENTTQGGVNVTTLSTYGADASTEAFDEPLDKQAVLNIASLFII